jgi:uncharacterized protein YggE
MRHVRLLIGLGIVAAVGVGLSTTCIQGQTNVQGQPAGGAGDANHKRITVTGVGTVTVKPDTARISFAIKGSGVDFKAAVADCDKKAAAVKKAIEDLQLGGLEVKTGPINVVHLNAGAINMFPGGPVPFQPGVPGAVPARPVGPAAPAPVGAPAPPVIGAAAPPVIGAPAPPVIGGAAPPVIGQPPVVGGGFASPGGIAPQPVIPGQPFPGFGGMAEVSRTFTVVATFGPPGMAGGLQDIVPVSDKILIAAVTAGATEAPVFNTQNQPFIAGINHNSRIEFYKANASQLRQEALKLAVADAVANAKAAAGVANLTAKDIVNISDQNVISAPFGLPGQPTTTGRGEVLGEMEVNIQISVTFSY